ncbi:DNA-directed RNA polymerase subunit beta [Abeliophyllum distichum]|uniref:DNA-directed RNA polymerase n=1 Tax=Abeliophyllum distichum TaxID=126358 RepID=A0ABD1V743_9LAMI
MKFSMAYFRGGAERVALNFPHGFRFDPIDNEVLIYLRKNILDQQLPANVIRTAYVYGTKLDELPFCEFKHGDESYCHYGRIFRIDTSEGINVGLIGSLAIHARIGHWGSLESPFYEISDRSIGVRMLYLPPGKDEYYMVAAGNSLALNRDIQEEQVVPARYRQEFLTIAWEQVHLRSIFPFQYFSIGASLIPFIEHNDANRALMSSNMQRQAVPLSRPEKCIVGTGLERQTALYSGALAIAEREGKIIYTDTEKILFSGYNFEDAVLISERLVYEDIYTSFHIRKYEIQTHVTNQGPERITNEIPHLEAHLLRNLDKNGIVMLGSWVETGDNLVGKLTPQMVKESSYAPEDRLLRAILGIQEKAEYLMERSGNPFEQPVIIGKPYILKLIHQVDDKIHGRSSVHYALVTQQPLRGRAKQGGQRVGEMEVWALEGFGVAHVLQEMLTYKSDHIRAHQEVLGTTIIGGTIPNPEDAPESFRLLVRELRSLALELNHFLVSEKNFLD